MFVQEHDTVERVHKRFKDGIYCERDFVTECTIFETHCFNFLIHVHVTVYYVLYESHLYHYIPHYAT